MKKRIVSICVASILVATLFSGCGKSSETKDDSAVETSISNNEVRAKYQSFLKDNQFETYAYVDIDQDGIDEMVAGTWNFILGIFGYEDGEVKVLAGTSDVKNTDKMLGEWLITDPVLYSKKEKLLLTYTQGTSNMYDVWEKENGELSHKKTGGTMDIFYINDKKVSQTECMRYLSKLERIKYYDSNKKSIGGSE